MEHVKKAIALLNETRELLERTAGAVPGKDWDLQDAADDIAPILLALEDWQRDHGGEV